MARTTSEVIGCPDAVDEFLSTATGDFSAAMIVEHYGDRLDAANPLRSVSNLLSGLVRNGDPRVTRVDRGVYRPQRPGGNVAPKQRAPEEKPPLPVREHRHEPSDAPVEAPDTTPVPVTVASARSGIGQSMLLLTERLAAAGIKWQLTMDGDGGRLEWGNPK